MTPNPNIIKSKIDYWYDPKLLGYFLNITYYVIIWCNGFIFVQILLLRLIMALHCGSKVETSNMFVMTRNVFHNLAFEILKVAKFVDHESKPQNITDISLLRSQRVSQIKQDQYP